MHSDITGGRVTFVPGSSPQIYPDRDGLNAQAEKYTPRRNQLLTRRKVQLGGYHKVANS